MSALTLTLTRIQPTRRLMPHLIPGIRAETELAAPAELPGFCCGRRETKTNGCDLIFFPFFPALQVIHVILVFRATTHHTLETERSVLSAAATLAAKQLCIPLLFLLRTFKWERK